MANAIWRLFDIARPSRRRPNALTRLFQLLITDYWSLCVAFACLPNR